MPSFETLVPRTDRVEAKTVRARQQRAMARIAHDAIREYLRVVLEAVSHTAVTAAAGDSLPRVAIVGGPRRGKSTLAAEYLAQGIPIYCGDPLSKVKDPMPGVNYLPEGLSFAGDTGGAAWIAENWFQLPGPWVCEGQVMARALRRWASSNENPDAYPCDQIIVLSEPRATTTAGQEAMHKGVMTVWAGIVDRFAPIIVSPPDAAVTAAAGTNDALGPDVDLNALDQSAAWPAILADTILPELVTITTGIGPQKYLTATVVNSVDAWRAKWLQERTQVLVGVADTITKDLRDAITADNTEHGPNPQRTAATVKAYLDPDAPMWKGRAQTIARTEVIGANNQGGLASWRAIHESIQHLGGQVFKTWLATEDSHTRPDHAAIDGTEVGIGGSFSVGGTQMDGPGDNSAPADEVINCRCTLTYRVDDGADAPVDDATVDADETLTAAAGSDVPTGVAVLLMLSADDAAALAVDGGEPPDQMHVTLGYLRDPASEYTDDVKTGILDGLAPLADMLPVTADAFATAHFNPEDDERDPCAVVLVQSDGLASIHDGVSDAIASMASTTFPIWIPHITCYYDVRATGSADSSAAGIGGDATDGMQASGWMSNLEPNAEQGSSVHPRFGSWTGQRVPSDRSGRSRSVTAPVGGRPPHLPASTVHGADAPPRSGRAVSPSAPRGGTAPRDVLDARPSVRLGGQAPRLGSLLPVSAGLGGPVSLAASGAGAGVGAERGRESLSESGTRETPVDSGVPSEGGAPASGAPRSIEDVLAELSTKIGGQFTFDRLVLAWASDQITVTNPPASPDQAVTAAVEAPVTAPAPTTDAPPQPADGTPTEAAPQVIPGAMQWEGVLAMVDTPSSDGRMIRGAGFSVRGLPLPLKYQALGSHGGEESGTTEIVGRILTAEVRGEQVWATGDFFDPTVSYCVTPAMEQVAAGIGCVSVDLPALVVSYLAPGPDGTLLPVDPMQYPGDPYDLIMVAEESELAAATIVDVPAFGDARINLVTDPSAPNLAPVTADAASPQAPVLTSESITFPDGTVLSVGDQVSILDPEGGEGTTGLIESISPETNEVTVAVEGSDSGTNSVTVDASQIDVVEGASDDTADDPAAATATPITAAMTFAGLEEEHVYPAEWFNLPDLADVEQRPHIRVTDDGRVYGLLAQEGSCHIGYGDCVAPPTSPTNYAYFHVGEVKTDKGFIPAGKITVGGGHADMKLGWRGTVEHYDNAGSAAAVVRAYDTEIGVVLAGALVPQATGAQIAALRRNDCSGDWRPIGGHRELVAALAVNTAGFQLTPRAALAADGRPAALVAAGIVHEPEPQIDVTLPSGAKLSPEDVAVLATAFAEAADQRTAEILGRQRAREVSSMRRKIERDALKSQLRAVS